MFGNLAEHLRRDILYGQLREHLLGSLGNVSRASEYKGKWSNWLWHHAEWDLVATIPDCLTSHRWITIIVGGSNVHERCMMSQSQKTQSNAMQDASLTCEQTVMLTSFSRCSHSTRGADTMPAPRTKTFLSDSYLPSILWRDRWLCDSRSSWIYWKPSVSWPLLAIIAWK